MADLFGMSVNVAQIKTVIIWVGLAVIFIMFLAFATLAYVMQKLTVHGLEIDFNNRIQKFNGRFKKDGKGVKQFWLGRLRKFIPLPSSDDVYFEGKKDFSVLLKDKNGLHHTLRIPNFEELKVWYKTVYNIDLENQQFNDTTIGRFNRKIQSQKEIKDIFFLPNPHERIEWLADKCIESNEEYKSIQWWQHPNVMIIGCAVICLIMFVMTLILSKRL